MRNNAIRFYSKNPQIKIVILFFKIKVHKKILTVTELINIFICLTYSKRGIDPNAARNIICIILK